MLEFRNQKTGDCVHTHLTREEILARFGETAREDNWLWFWLTKTVNDASNRIGQQDMIAFIGDSFLLASGMGLKRPQIRLSYNNRRFKIYLSARGTLCFKSGALIPGTQDPQGNEAYVGCLFDGKFLPNRDRKVLPVEAEFFAKLSADPVGFMAECSKDMGRCCYCNLPLEDARSKEVGYGPVCAVRWGLTWGEKRGSEHVPSFAELWSRANPADRRSIRGICSAIRQTPGDSLLWDALGDILEENGHTKRPVMPTGPVRMSRA